MDHHCHPLRRWPVTLSALDLRAAFTEALDPSIPRDHVIHTAAYQGAIRRLASELGCDPQEDAVLERRNRAEPRTYARQLLQGTGLMLVDTGFAFPGSFTPDDQDKALDIPQREIIRLETLAETLVPRSADANAWLAAVAEALHKAVDHGAVGVKTISAYRAGLSLRYHDADELAAAFRHLKERAQNGAPLRLTGSPLCHPLLFMAARECVRLQLPLQVHCGYGDPDEDLADASPLGLRPLFTDPAYHGLRVALLHCYPYHREAAYLCSVFPGVFMDVSLAIPLAALDGQRALKEALGLCPISKLLYATDASRYPEVFFVAAGLHREALAEALGELIDRQFITVAQAIRAGQQILAENAKGLYGLTG